MSLSQQAASNVFIDLATFSEPEGFIYGGPTAITWFVRGVQKANWFSYIPIQLRHQGTVDFNQRNASASVNRSGDYVLACWFRTRIPQVQLGQVDGGTGTVLDIFVDATIRWTRNLMHNLFRRVSITFNELTVEELDNVWMDYNYQFRLRGSKRVGYRNMIGDIAAMTTPVGLAPAVLGTGGNFTCPFPFWFSEDTGVALPVAALPFNDIKLNYEFRALSELLVVFPGTAAAGANPGSTNPRIAQLSDVVVVGGTTAPTLEDPQTFAHYAVVHNDERVKMGDAPRDILIHQVQIVQDAAFRDVSTRNSFDLRLSHAVTKFCFAAQNITTAGEQSNYTTEPNYAGQDPIAFSTLVYENTTRLAMGSDYYSLTHPYYTSTAIPDETGYHMWSYALHAWLYNPSGSTNFSKLANVSILHDMGPAAINAANTTNPTDSNGNPILFPDSAGVLQISPQSWNHVFRAQNWNIVRVANGSLGHPTL